MNSFRSNSLSLKYQGFPPSGCQDIRIRKLEFVAKNQFLFTLTRLLGRFVPMFYLNCEHVLYVYIVKQNKNNSRIFTKNLVDFDGDKYLKFWSFINLPCSHVRSHKKFGPDWFSRFDVYWIQTNRQTDRQAKFIWFLYVFLW